MSVHDKRPEFNRFFYCLFFIVLLLAAAAVPAAAQYDWQGPKYAAEGVNPDYVIDPETGMIHLLIIKNNMDPRWGGLWYQIIDADGRRIHSEQVPGAERESGWKNFHADIALDSEGDPHIIYRFYDYFAGPYWDLFYTNKKNGEWSDPLTVNLDVDHGYVVSMVMDSNDRIHIGQSRKNHELTELYEGDFGDVLYYSIYDNVVDKQSVITDPTQRTYRTDDRFELGVTSDDKIHLIVSNPHWQVGNINYYRSSDSGDTWELFADIHSPQSPVRNGYVDVSIDTTDNIHFIYGTMNDLGVQNKPSIRYVRYWHDWKTRETIVTGPGDIEMGWACGSVAASDDGQLICVAYTSHRGYGVLYATISENGGLSWSEPQKIANWVGEAENYGRNYHVARANNNSFYVIYPYEGRSYLRFLRHLNDNPPTASAGGPYTGIEGDVIELDASGSRDSGQNPGIIEYAWDFDGNGTWELITEEAKLSYTFPDDYAGETVLRVTDHAGQTAFDTTTISVVNSDPEFTVTGPRTVNENETFTLTCTVTDRGVLDEHIITWDMGDGTGYEGSEIEHVYPDEGTGQYTVSIYVVDDDGGSAEGTLIMTVKNLPPTADSGGPYYVAPQDTIIVTGTGEDPGPQDILTASWDTDFDGVFDTPGWSAEVSFPVTGVYNLRFKVEDDDGAFSVDTTYVQVDNGPPVLSEIPGQTIEEGGVFEAVNLADYVSDPEHGPEQMNWLWFGNTDLQVTLESFMFSVAVPDSEWAGQEIITLIAEDPLGLRDSTDIRYTVEAVNDPPYWKTHTAYTINEDDTLSIPLSELRSYAGDIDNRPEELTFALHNNVHTHGEEAGNFWLFYADPDWYGREEVIWTVTDPGGLSDSMHTVLEFLPVEDHPDPFRVISPLSADSTAWPDSIRFVWETTVDPDSNDHVFYRFTLQTQGGSPSGYSFESGLLSDTTFLYQPSGEPGNGVFFWFVHAQDLSGNKTRSTNHGTIYIDDNSAVEDPAARLPERFELLQNHPNPFNPETSITYHLPAAAEVELTVYNMLGQQICQLDSGRRQAGVHTVLWKGVNGHGQTVPSGIYVYALRTDGRVFIKKMLLLQ